jgi:hypothetical protein
MGIEFGKNDFEDDSIVLGADRDHTIDYPDPVASRAEQAFVDSLPREGRRQRLHRLRERPEGNEYTISGVGNLIADITPVIGDIKAAYELPNDLSYAFELVERGYEERDLKKMGLGGAFATLSAMGIIPAVRIGAKAGKEAIKSQLQKSVDLDKAIEKDMEKGLAKAQGYDVKELSEYGKIIEELALIGKSNNGEILESQIVNKLQSSIGEAPNEEVVKQFKTYLEGSAGFKIEPLVKASEIKAPEGLDIKPEDIKAAKAAKQFLSQEEKDALTSAFDDLEQTVAPKKDIFGLTPKVQDELISDFEMLGNAQNQIVTNKQIKEVIEIKTGFTPNVQTTNEIQAALNDKGISTINSFDEFKKLTGQDIQELSIQKREPLEKTKPKVDVIGGTFAKMDVDMTPDQKFIVDRIRSNLTITRNLSDTYGQGSLAPNVAEGMHNIKIKGKLYNIKNRADQIELVKMLPKSIRRTVIEEMNRPIPKIFHGSAGVSQPYGRAYGDMTRAEVLEKEGFMPFTDFEEGVEVGIGGSKGASGKHAELGKKMLSTSRDPLVSIKRAFGDLVPANVVSAPFPRGKVRGMTREEYTAPSTKSQYIQDDTAAGLPRTRHKEAEIAFSTPEELEDIRQLSQTTERLEDSVDRDALKNLGKMSLEDRVKTGQRFATGVKDKINTFYTRMDVLNPNSLIVAKRAQDAYADLRNLLKDTQSLGQFTEQYGARGTYDSLLETLFKDTDRTVKKLGGLLPEGEKKENVQMLASVFDAMKDKRFVLDTGKPSLRGVSDKKLKEMLKDGFSRAELLQEKSYSPSPNYEDLKRMVFLLTDKFNRGGLMARR